MPGTDQHGDLTAAYTPTGSATSLAGAAAYGPWGQVTSSTGAMPGAGYQGDYTDPATGLVDMNARWFNPATGTFTSSDTLGGSPVPSAVDGNPYAYADGNPLTETDPTGNWGCGWCGSLVHSVAHTSGLAVTGLVSGAKSAARYAAPAGGARGLVGRRGCVLAGDRGDRCPGGGVHGRVVGVRGAGRGPLRCP